MKTAREPAIKAIGISKHLYEMIDTLCANEGKRTIKESAEQLLHLGLAAKRGEYIRAEETPAIVHKESKNLQFLVQ